MPAKTTFVVVDVARAKFAVVSFVTLQAGALVNAALKVIVNDAAPVVVVETLPAESVLPSDTNAQPAPAQVGLAER